MAMVSFKRIPRKTMTSHSNVFHVVQWENLKRISR
ncbi:hypothetical protein F383_38845 [Gossypium arboreum]|uniref:Uncharacterized protein n=1 Tax=Gossypium arboreum TaxID=29729 RepID=A0A0B0MI15_GOSAR|nr:hypothetical protein F383_38845 [Gossypium arboreum]